MALKGGGLAPLRDASYCDARARRNRLTGKRGAHIGGTRDVWGYGYGLRVGFGKSVKKARTGGFVRVPVREGRRVLPVQRMKAR